MAKFIFLLVSIFLVEARHIDSNNDLLRFVRKQLDEGFGHFAPDDVEEEREASSTLQYVKNWPSEPPKLGQVAGVSYDSAGRLHVFHRGRNTFDGSSFDQQNRYMKKTEGPIGVDTVLRMNPETGAVEDRWGQNMFYLPHGLKVDSEGNFWMTDVALHQVLKFSPKKELLLTLGEKFVPGSDDAHFCKPADVAVASSGEFFVADGYCNSRVMKFAANGTFLKSFSGPASSPMVVSHSVTLIEEEDLVCAADRERGRVLCFNAGLTGDNAGRLEKVFRDPRLKRIFAITYDANKKRLYAVSGPAAQDEPTGATFDVETGETIALWEPRKGFGEPHDVDVSPDGETVVVAEINPNVVHKFSY